MISYVAQFNDVQQSLRYDLERQGKELERLTAQLKFADQLCAAHPEQRAKWQVRILEAGQMAGAKLREPSVDLEAVIAAAEAILAPIGQAAKEYTLLCVSHAHIDMNWMWSWPETVAVTNDTFQTMLALMDEFPEFIFTQSQASVYDLIERYNPAMFEVIRQRVREGRWEVTASQWVEGDKNMSSGESISRHLLYTRAYMQDKFGLNPEDVQVDFEPDTFGHPATLPTILAQGGVCYYYHCRGSHGPHLYWWQGRDSSRLLTLNDVVWYMCAIEPNIAEPLVEFCQATGLKFKPVLYGVGDHGGGPTRRDLRRIAELDSWPIYPNVRCSTLHQFFRSAEQQAADLPEIEGERNFVFTGCYTSQARIKQANRHGENLLYAAEAAATIGAQVAGVPYPRENLEEAWTHLLFDQFHDILPGSGTRDTRHYALGRAQESQAAAGMARSSALRALAARVDTASLRQGFAQDGERPFKDAAESERSLGAGVGYAAGTGGESAYSAAQAGDRAFLVFNPLPFERHEVVEAKLWDTALDETQLVVTYEGAEPLPVQILDKGRYWGHEYTTVAFPVRVPALGYRTVCVSDRRAELGLARKQDEDPWAGMLGSWRQIQPSDYALENEHVRAQLDPASGGLRSLLDKRTGREWVPEGAVSGILQYNVEAHEGMTAWVIGQFLKRKDLLDGGHLVQVHTGPYLSSYRWSRRIGASSLELDISLRRGSPRLEYSLRVDWREMGSREEGIPHLRVRFPLAIDRPTVSYAIPFGAISRDLSDGQEVPALRWADLLEADGAGVTLTNTSKYGHSLDGHSLEMTLLRSSIDPDPLPDLGEHVIEYALQPHVAGWAAGSAMRAGQTTNVPLSVVSCAFHPGKLPTALSFARIHETNVHLAALKQGQSGGVLVRLVEVEGVETEAHVELDSRLIPGAARGSAGVARCVDTLERPTKETSTAQMDGRTLVVRLPAHGIVTVQIVSG
jgi:alpha-mannosidase